MVPAGRGARRDGELGKWVSAPASRRERMKHPLLGWPQARKPGTSATPGRDYGTRSPQSRLPNLAGCCSRRGEPTRWDLARETYYACSAIVPLPIQSHRGQLWLCPHGRSPLQEVTLKRCHVGHHNQLNYALSKDRNSCGYNQSSSPEIHHPTVRLSQALPQIGYFSSPTPGTHTSI